MKSSCRPRRAGPRSSHSLCPRARKARTPWLGDHGNRSRDVELVMDVAVSTRGQVVSAVSTWTRYSCRSFPAETSLPSAT